MEDVDSLLACHKPHICILTEVGSAIHKKPIFTNYHTISQPGTNSFGGVMILHLNSLKCKVIEKELNFLLIELISTPNPIYIGAIYVPPKSLPPFQLLTKFQNKPCYIFGDYNGKHTNWKCIRNNTSGVHLQEWLENTGNEMIIPNKSTSKRSEAVIDFGITLNANGWTSEVLDEGTSDHYPVLFQSSIAIHENSLFRKTYWNIFKFFLELVYQYWLSIVYNIDEQNFFDLFSEFLSSLWDRCSVYENSCRYRPPWPAELVQLAKSVNRARRAYRRNKNDYKLQFYLDLKRIYLEKRNQYLQEKREKNIEWISKEHNIWKFVRPQFHAYSPPFKGLTVGTEIIKDEKKIVEILANFFEKHFKKPEYNINNEKHVQAIEIFEQIKYLPNIPLEQISIIEVEREWKNFKSKKSTDSTGTSAYMLKQLPKEYLGIITVLFNKCATSGNFFEKSKHAKVVCLSKDGLYPTENKLRPISLLPNIGKWFERIIHRRIIKWCEMNNIFVDEQSGFTSKRRLQTRIISIVEDMRLTIAACNRPALTIFVDFMSAFDNMFFPALISCLTKLEMPLPYIKWITSWLSNRTLSIYYGDRISRSIKMEVGAPQGSILAATLFRLHIHFLPSIFRQASVHLFADDLAILLSGSLEKKFSENINELEERGNKTMENLEKYSEDILLPVNVSKTKALLVHSVVSPKYPKIKYKNKKIEYVKQFKYLGVTIATKLGWGKYIEEKLKKIRGTYNAMKILFHSIPKKQITTRRKIFFAFSLPHFIWLLPTWFFFTERQQQKISEAFTHGIKIVYGLGGWDNLTTQIISRERTLYDYLYNYWTRFSLHLNRSLEASLYQHTWTAYNIAKDNEMWYKLLGFRRNNKFLKRLSERVEHSNNDWIVFEANHKPQYEYFKKSTSYLNLFIYKYFL